MAISASVVYVYLEFYEEKPMDCNGHVQFLISLFYVFYVKSLDLQKVGRDSYTLYL